MSLDTITIWVSVSVCFCLLINQCAVSYSERLCPIMIWCQRHVQALGREEA